MSPLAADKQLIMTIRTSDAVWDTLDKAVKEANRAVIDIASKIVMWAGLSRTFNSKSANASLFKMGEVEDHPGDVLNQEQIDQIEALLAEGGRELTIVHSISGPNCNSRAMNLLFMLNYIKRNYIDKNPSNPLKIRLVLSSDEYNRNDKAHSTAVVDDNGYPVLDKDGMPLVRLENNIAAGEEFPHMLKAAGVSELAMIDTHSNIAIDNYRAAFGEDFTHLSVIEDQAEKFIEMYRDDILTLNVMYGAPDGEDKMDDRTTNAAVERARLFAYHVWSKTPELQDAAPNFDEYWATSNFGAAKRRTSPNKSEIVFFRGEVAKKVCVAIDDVSDTGGSIEHVAEHLKRRDAREVVACLSHGPSTRETFQRLLGAKHTNGDGPVDLIDRMIVSDSQPGVSKRVNEHVSPDYAARVSVVSVGRVVLNWVSRNTGAAPPIIPLENLPASRMVAAMAREKMAVRHS